MGERYDLVVKTANVPHAGTAHEVWFKLAGTLDSTHWFHFDNIHGDPTKLFQPGKIATGIVEASKPLGKLVSCSVKLHPQHGNEPELLLESIEVIADDQEVMWRVSEWITPGSPIRVRYGDSI